MTREPPRVVLAASAAGFLIVAAGIEAAGDELVYAEAVYGGCDIYVVGEWSVCRSIRAQGASIVYFDRGMIDPAKRIFAVNGWGALAAYPTPCAVDWIDVPNRANLDGPLLVIGQVSRSHKPPSELTFDQWDTPGYERWIDAELKKPNRKFREHPRVWKYEQGRREIQSTLEKDLEGCSGAIGWNSTALIHAAMLGYPVEGVEPHAMVRRFTPREIAGLEWTVDECRDGTAWRAVRQLASANCGGRG